MKKLLFIFSLLISLQSFGQTTDYGDSTITLTITQRFTYWIGTGIRTDFDWNNRNAPTQLKNYIGSGLNPDSIISQLSFKAKFVLKAMDAMIAQPLQVGYQDYRAVVLNQPTLPGYTSLNVQISAKAAGSSSEKNVAQWLKDKYQERVTAYDALYAEQLQQTINWSRN